MIYYLLRISKNGCLAQSGEHRLYTAGVGSSSLSTSTKKRLIEDAKMEG